MMRGLLRAMDRNEEIASTLRKLRKRAGLTMADMAKAINLRGASSWQRYENPDQYAGGYLGRDMVARLHNALVGKGNPPIKKEEIWALAGPEFAAATPLLISSFDPDQHRDEHVSDWDGQGGAYIDGQVTYQGQIEGALPEFSMKPGLGQGQTDDRVARVTSNGIATGHPVVNEWVIPPNYVRNALDATPNQVVILPVIGHSMQPILNPNDRIMVDVSQNIWLGDAVYVIDDGDGVLQAKTVRKVMSSNPPRFQIVSEANPAEEPVVRRVDEFRIVGRVVGRFTRM